MTRRALAGMLVIVPATRVRRIVGAAITAAVLSGCDGGTETGNPSIGEVSYTAYSSAPERVGVRSGGTAATVDAVWLDLGAVGFMKTCDGNGAASATAPALGAGDHAAGQHNVTSFEFEDGSFCGVSLPFDVAKQRPLPAGAPDALREHSVVLTGTRADGVPLTILGDGGQVFRLAATSGPFSLTSSTAKTLLAFDVARWLDLDLTTAVPEGGSIEVSASKEPTLFATFQGNLASGISLYRDADGDGRIDATPEELARGK